MKWAGLFLAVIFLSVTKYSPTYAQYASGVVITEVMTASSASASSEFVEIYNQSDTAVNLTDWKVQYQASSSNPLTGSWTTKSSLDGQLKAHGFALVSSSIFNTEKSVTGDFQLSSGLSGTAGRLSDGINTTDSLTWGVASALEGTSAAAPSAGHSLKRTVDSDALFVDNNNNSTDFVLSDQPFAQGGGVEDIVVEPVDVCLATPEIDLTVPDGYEIDANGDCVKIVQPLVCSKDVIINEFLSDPVGLEADGGEFVELYNASSSDAPLVGCGLHSSKSSQPLIEFIDSDVVPAGGYYVVSLADKLTNSSGSVTFSNADQDNIVTYSNLKEGQAMALFGDAWEVTNQPTAMAKNLPYVEPGLGSGDTSQVSSTLEPCPAGKYRNPDTNRCKNTDSTDTALASCDAGQYRNPETNRCKKIASTASTLTPCSPGQERNPETNRCRKVSSTTSSLKPCESGYERNPDTNRCRKLVSASGPNQFAAEDSSPNGVKLNTIAVGSFMTAALGYAAFEYRSEALGLYKNVRAKFTKGRPPD